MVQMVSNPALGELAIQQVCLEDLQRLNRQLTG